MDFYATIDLSIAGARATYCGAPDEPKAPVRVVLPSEYAHQDIATAPVFEMMRRACLTEGGLR